MKPRLPIPVAARSKPWVCGRSLVGIAGSNLAEGMHVCLLWVLCFVRKRSLRQSDHWSGGVLPSAVCSECDLEVSIMRPWPIRGCRAMGGKNMLRLIKVLTTMSVNTACDLSILFAHFRNNLEMFSSTGRWLRRAYHSSSVVLLAVCLCVCVCVCVYDLGNSTRGGLRPSWTVASQNKYNRKFMAVYTRTI